MRKPVQVVAEVGPIRITRPPVRGAGVPAGVGRTQGPNPGRGGRDQYFLPRKNHQAGISRINFLPGGILALVSAVNQVAVRGILLCEISPHPVVGRETSVSQWVECPKELVLPPLRGHL